MFVNGCMTASSVSVKENSVAIAGASGIPFLNSSGYKYVTAGSEVNLTFFLDNTSTPLANRAVNLVAPQHYSVFIGGTVSYPIYLFTNDDLTPPTSGNVKLRFVNLSPDNINETATVNDTIVAPGIAINTISSFCQVKAGACVIGVFDPFNNSTAFHTDTMILAGGKMYTVMLTGSATGALADTLSLSVIKNN